MAEKVTYGVKNVYYAKITYSGDAVTYSTPVSMPGARSISLSANGDSTDWWADNVSYFTMSANSGYEGDLVLAALPDSFRTDILGEVLDSTGGFYYESVGATTNEFALLFQFEADSGAVRHCFYRCTADRPSIESSTVDGGTATPNEISVTIHALPRIEDDLVKSRCESTATAYSSWFTTVQEPA